MTIGHIFALAIKEFLALFRDKRSRLVIIGPPIMQLIVFGFAATYDLNHVPIAIYNQDKGQISRDLVSKFEGSPNFKIIQAIDHDGQVAPLINNRDALFVLTIGPNFSSDLLRGQQASLQAVFDGRNSNTAMIAMNYLVQV